MPKQKVCAHKRGHQRERKGTSQMNQPPTDHFPSSYLIIADGESSSRPYYLGWRSTCTLGAADIEYAHDGMNGIAVSTRRNIISAKAIKSYRILILVVGEDRTKNTKQSYHHVIIDFTYYQMLILLKFYFHCPTKCSEMASTTLQIIRTSYITQLLPQNCLICE